MAADWELPALTTTEETAPSVVLVRAKLAWKSDMEATTANEPLTSLATRAGAVATPLVPVATVTATASPGKKPPAPEEGAKNSTSAPVTGQPPVSTTSASRATG